jgi:thioredoxin 1
MKVLYFSAPWCAPCKTFAPTFDEVVKAHSEVEFTKVNIDEDFELAKKYAVRGVPCIVALEGDKEVARIAGGLTKTKLEQLLS